MPAMIQPVMGPATMPVWPRPNAYQSFPSYGDGPIMRIPSGILCRFAEPELPLRER